MPTTCFEITELVALRTRQKPDKLPNAQTPTRKLRKIKDTTTLFEDIERLLQVYTYASRDPIPDDEFEMIELDAHELTLEKRRKTREENIRRQIAETLKNNPQLRHVSSVVTDANIKQITDQDVFDSVYPLSKHFPERTLQWTRTVGRTTGKKRLDREWFIPKPCFPLRLGEKGTVSGRNMQWRPVPFIPGYMVSSRGGFVKCLESNRIYGGQRHTDGTRHTSLKWLDTHYYNNAFIVACAFIPNANEFAYVNPHDGDIENIDVCNLVWSSAPAYVVVKQKAYNDMMKSLQPGRRKRLRGERWKQVDLVSYPDLVGFKVSNKGRIWTPDNYVHYGCRLPGDYYYIWHANHIVSVHRIIVNTWIRRIDHTDLVVDHVNGKRWCNLLENLEPVTNRENIQRAHQLGLCKKGLLKRIVFADGCWFQSTKQSEIDRAISFLGQPLNL